MDSNLIENIELEARPLNSASCITLGIITERDLEAMLVTVELDNGEELADIEVHYHCQTSHSAHFGILAFSVGDHVVVARGPNKEESKVIGFADTNLRYCLPPLVIAGHNGDFPYTYTIEGNTASFNGSSVVGCSPRFLNPMFGNVGMYQVKYAPTTLPYTIKVDGEPDAAGVRNVRIMISIAKGVIVAPGPSPDTVRHHVRVNVQDLDSFQLFSQDFIFSASSAPDTLSLSAALSPDFMTLYIAWGDNGGSYIDPPATNIMWEKYAINIADNFTGVSWDYVGGGPFAVAYNLGHSYVSRNGLFYGLYKRAAGYGEHEYARLDLTTFAVESNDRYSIGYTVADGDFQPIWEKYTKKEPSPVPFTGYTNYAGVSCYTTLTYIDDGLSMNDESQPSCSTPDGCISFGCAWSPLCYEMRIDRKSWRLWYEMYSYDESADQTRITYQWPGNSVVGGKTNSIERSGEGESEPRYSFLLPCAGYPCTQPICEYVSTSIKVNNRQVADDHTDYIIPALGTLTRYQSGSIVTRALEIDSPCTGDCVCYAPPGSSYVVDCGCAPTPGMGGYYWWKANYCGNFGDIIDTESFDTFPHVVHPLDIPHATGFYSFISHDGGEDGVTIIGVQYNDEDTEEKKFRIHIDGVNVTSSVYSCSGFDVDSLHYVGFLW